VVLAILQRNPTVEVTASPQERKSQNQPEMMGVRATTLHSERDSIAFYYNLNATINLH